MKFIAVSNGKDDYYIQKDYIYCVEKHPETLTITIRIESFSEDNTILNIIFNNKNDLNKEYMRLKYLLGFDDKINSYNNNDNDMWSE